MICRSVLVLGLLCAGLLLAPHLSFAANADIKVIEAASARLAHQSPPRVVRWLGVQPAVRSAAIGRDHATVSIAFRDGGTIAILPRVSRSASVAAQSPRLPLRPMVNPAAGAARAAVWEPFATELGLGPHAGDPEVNALQSAGFQVDQAYDASVTVASMANLASYNVVYMHTHTGVNGDGTGVLATGQPASCSPYTSPDGTVVVVGVAGTTACYYAITSRYITNNEPSFAPHAIIFVNGCALLQSTEFWNALSAKGTGVLLSWDNDSRTFDDYLSAAAFFNQMSSGATVSAALNTLYANSYGKSSYNGQTATLGFRGDGSVTLQEAGANAPPSATSTPTATPTRMPNSTPTPTSTPRPAATSTPTSTSTSTPAATDTPTPTATSSGPAPAATLSASVKPGADQRIAVSHADPNTGVHVVVSFPSGDHETIGATADGQGAATLSFRQQPSKITRRNQTARVTIGVSHDGRAFTLTERYTIAFGKIDASVQPREQKPGHWITIWVHASKRTPVDAVLRLPHGAFAVYGGRTGAQGWVDFRYRLPIGLKAGEHITVRAEVHANGRLLHTATSLTVA